MKMVLILLAVGTFGLYWAWMRFGFARPDYVHPKMGMLAIAAVASGLLHTFKLLTVQLSEDYAVLGLVLYMLAVGLFLWSAITIRGADFALAFSASPPRAVLATGPYRWVRHPFYLAYSMTWIAGTIVCRSVVLLATVVVMLWFYIDAARQEEHQFLSGSLREGYLAYKAKVGVFGPKILSCWLRRREA
jgi:protein-S-isoprenylcysteine O-methyltransferase Ste14